MCILTHGSVAAHSQPTKPNAAKALNPDQRQKLAVQALAGTATVTQLAAELEVSRKFVYQQQAIAQDALDNTFDPDPTDNEVLFHLPVTKNWLQQFTLGLVLIGHAPFHRDADTWGIHILELKDRGFDPDAVVADAGTGLRAGVHAALPEVPCRSDVFHVLKEVYDIARLLENRAYRAMQECDDLRRTIARHTRTTQRKDTATRDQLAQQARDQLARALQNETRAIELADDVTLLADWLRHDILALAGPPHAERLALFEFVRAELQARVCHAPDRLGKLVRYLGNQRDDVLAFAAELDGEFAALAESFEISPEIVRELFAVNDLPLENGRRWHRDADMRRVLGRYYFPLTQELDGVRERTVRASSVVENLNSRLRGYFFLRRQLGNEYLGLLQFFLNHRRFFRSEHPERVDKSPTELLTGESHPHWVELLGFTRFSRN